MGSGYNALVLILNIKIRTIYFSLDTRLITYNCSGLPKHCDKLYKRPTVISLFKQCDILCLQETWFSKQDLKLLNSLHNEFHGTGAAIIDLGDKSYHEYPPPRGVAILWHNSTDKYIERLKCEYDWITGVTLKMENKTIVILCVYMPCMNSIDNRDDEYIKKIAVISSIIEELTCTCIQIYIVIGMLIVVIPVINLGIL